MKKLIFPIAIAALLLASCGNKNEAPKNNDSVAAQPAGTEAKAAYECPMHCEGDKTYETPGKCPACGMDLKEKK
ncbi:MAG: hypothetical protein Fur0041_09300 [Bacteroidia bacterium]